MLINVLDILQKAAEELASLLLLVGALFSQPNVVAVVPPPQPLVIYGAQAPEDNANRLSTLLANAAAELDQIVPGLLPKVEFPATRANTSTEPAPPAQTATKTVTAITGRWLLDNSKLTLNQKIDGSYWPSFSVDLGGSKKFNWDLSAAVIGGGTVPKFDVSFSCNPVPNNPAADSLNQSPSFEVRTYYSCFVSLTDSAGRKFDRQFNFQTGTGRLAVKTSNSNVLLKNGLNISAFVFDNQDSEPITLNGLVFDASFASLSTSTPLAVRFVNPKNETALYELRMENLPPILSRPGAYGLTNVQANFPFTIGGKSEKALFVEAVGVNWTYSAGINPEIKITLKNVLIDKSDVQVMISSPTISLSCIPHSTVTDATGVIVPDPSTSCQ